MMDEFVSKIDLAAEKYLCSAYHQGTGMGKGIGPHYHFHDYPEPLSVSRQEGQILFAISRFCGPSTILELGTGTGYSTAWLAAGGPEAELTTAYDYTEGSVGEEEISVVGRLLEELGLANVTIVRDHVQSFKELKADLVFMDGKIKHDIQVPIETEILIEHDATGKPDPGEGFAISTSSRLSVQCGDKAYLKALIRLCSMYGEIGA